MVIWTLYDALSFLKVFGTVAWTLSEQLSGQRFDHLALKSDKVEILLRQ